MTDFNNKAAMGKPMFVGSAKSNDLPLDVRTRIDTIDEMSEITFPYVGMIVYVRDEDAYYSVKTLKGEELKPGMAATFTPNYKIDTYEPFSGGAAPAKETVVEACDPSDPDAKTVVADDADPFDPDTQIKVSDANAKAAEGVTFSPGDTVKEVEVTTPVVDLSEITARIEHLESLHGLDDVKYEASTDGTGLEVVADDQDPFDPNTQIKVSDANKNGGNFQVGDKVKPVDTTGSIKVPGYEASTDGTGLEVVPDDQDPFDPNTQIKVSDANKGGGSFEVGDKVKPTDQLVDIADLLDRLKELEEKMNEVNPDPLPIEFDAYIGTIDSSGTESLTKYTINKPGAGEAYEFPVNMTSAAKVVIEYPQSIGALVSISDTNTGMELLDGFTQTTTTRASVAHYRYTLNNAVVLKDSFLFYWSK